jgi:hypothetical protein
VHERLAVQAARRGLRHAPSVRDAHHRVRLRQIHVLPQRTHREARAPAVGDARVHLCLALARLRERIAAQREKLLTVHGAASVTTRSRR